MKISKHLLAISILGILAFTRCINSLDLENSSWSFNYQGYYSEMFFGERYMMIYESTSGIMLTYEYYRDGLNINYQDSTKIKSNILKILDIHSSNEVVGYLWNKDTLVFRRIEDNRFTIDDITRGEEKSYLLFNQDFIKREREFAIEFGNIDTTRLGYGLFRLKNDALTDTVELK